MFIASIYTRVDYRILVFIFLTESSFWHYFFFFFFGFVVVYPRVEYRSCDFFLSFEFLFFGWKAFQLFYVLSLVNYFSLIYLRLEDKLLYTGLVYLRVEDKLEVSLKS
jgi:hypothetical protein